MIILWNCHYNLPPRVCVTGRADLSRAVCAGQHTSVDQPMTADNGITSQHTTPRRRYTQLRGNGSGSNYDETLVHSQSDNPSVCTLVAGLAGRGEFSHCNDDDDNRTERAFLQQIAAVRARGHSPGRSHSLPPPSQRTQGLGPVAITSSLMTANEVAVQSVEGRTVCMSDKENIQPPREYMDSSMRPRPVQPQSTAWGLDRHQLGRLTVSQSGRTAWEFTAH